MLKRFLPKQDKFFDLLTHLSQSVLEASQLLTEMLNNLEMLAEYSSKIHIIENKCDDFIHQISNELNETFITPFDREDIYSLASSLDDIIDGMDSIGVRLTIYKLKTPLAFGQQLSEILLSQVKILTEVVSNLQDDKNAMRKLIEVRNLETEGDAMFRQALGNLFDTEKDFIQVIKKKEILEMIERTVDRCQTATIVIERILIKHL